MRIDHDMVDRPTVLSPIYGSLQQGAAPSNLNYDPEYLEESTPSVTVVAIAFHLTSSVSRYSNGQTGFWYLRATIRGSSSFLPLWDLIWHVRRVVGPTCRSAVYNGTDNHHLHADGLLSRPPLDPMVRTMSSTLRVYSW